MVGAWVDVPAWAGCDACMQHTWVVLERIVEYTSLLWSTSFLRVDTDL